MQYRLLLTLDEIQIRKRAVITVHAGLGIRSQHDGPDRLYAGKIRGHDLPERRTLAGGDVEF
jgi:hypothetical protein